MSNRIKNTLSVALAVSVVVLLGACNSQGGNQQAAMKPAVKPGLTTNGPAKTIAKVTTYVPSAAIEVFKSCNLSRLDAHLITDRAVNLQNSKPHSFAGWSVAPSGNVTSFYLRLDNKAEGKHYQIQFTPTIKRSDVATAEEEKGVQAPLLSGFMIEVPPKSVPNGNYHAYIAVNSHGTTSICDNGRHVEYE